MIFMHLGTDDHVLMIKRTLILVIFFYVLQVLEYNNVVGDDDGVTTADGVGGTAVLFAGDVVGHIHRAQHYAYCTDETHSRKITVTKRNLEERQL